MGGQLTRRHLEIAKRRLKHFYVVSVLERLEDSTELLARRLGWKDADANANRRGTKNTLNDLSEAEAKMTEEQIAQRDAAAAWLRATNQLDIELYNYGNTILDDLLKQEGIKL